MIIGNFTPDTIDWMHVGQVGKLKPGEVDDFPDARAKHILNKWGARGLIQIRFEDTQNPKKYEQKQREAMRIYDRFWKEQISNFNQLNEARKNENKPYKYPTELLEKKAEDFGIELIAPWKSAPKTDAGELRDLKNENEALKSSMGDMIKQITELTNTVKHLTDKVETSSIDTAELITKFRNLGKDKYKQWVFDNFAEVMDWPESVQSVAKDKWAKFYSDEDWPGDALKE